MAQKSYTFDSLLELKDAGAITSDAAAQVDSTDKIVNVGDARVDGTVVIDVASLAVDGGDESYALKLQGSTSSTFASGNVNLAVLLIGCGSVIGASADSTAGHYELPFTNEQDGEVYPYLRMYTDGTGSTWSINYTAWIAKR